MSDQPGTTRISETTCPYCDHKLDAVSHMTDHDTKPNPGDITVCISCAQVLVLDDALVPRKPAPCMVEQVFRDDPEFAAEVALYQRAVRMLDRRSMR